MSLFRRDPETLDGFKPKFTREFMRFGYTLRKVQIGGGLGDMDFNPNDIEFRDEHTITIYDVTLVSTDYYSINSRVSDIIASMCNKFLKDEGNKERHPKAWKFLTENAAELNNSNRYWLAIEHLEQIEKVRKEIADLQDQVRRAEYVASINAVEVKQRRKLTQDERNMLYAEFSGGETPGE